MRCAYYLSQRWEYPQDYPATSGAEAPHYDAHCHLQQRSRWANDQQWPRGEAATQINKRLAQQGLLQL